MPIFTVIAVIVVVGVILWLVNTFIPMEPNVKKILNAVVIILLVLWLLSLFFPMGSLGTIHTPRS